MKTFTHSYSIIYIWLGITIPWLNRFDDLKDFPTQKSCLEQFGAELMIVMLSFFRILYCQFTFKEGKNDLVWSTEVQIMIAFVSVLSWTRFSIQQLFLQWHALKTCHWVYHTNTSFSRQVERSGTTMGNPSIKVALSSISVVDEKNQIHAFQ